MPLFFSHFTRIVYKNNLFQDRQRILLAVSGGVDSLVLCTVMAAYRDSLKERPLFLEAAYVKIPEVALPERRLEQLEDFLGSLKIKLTLLEGEVSPERGFRCYTCARERRKELCRYGYSHNFDALAFGHTSDDHIETALMNLIYHGNLMGLLQEQKMFGGLITVIRPLRTIPKKWILNYAKEKGITPFQKKCPYEDRNKRDRIRKLLEEISAFHKPFRENLLQATNRWMEFNGFE